MPQGGRKSNILKDSFTQVIYNKIIFKINNIHLALMLVDYHLSYSGIKISIKRVQNLKK